MLQKQKVPHKLSRLLRQKRFILDCTNYQKSKYQEYNSFKDKYLGYIVSCPPNNSLPKPCRSKLIKNLLKTQIVQTNHIDNQLNKTVQNISRLNTQPSEQISSRLYKNIGSREKLKKMMHNNWFIR